MIDKKYSLKELKKKAIDKNISLSKICKDLNISYYRLQNSFDKKEDIVIKIFEYLENFPNFNNKNECYKKFLKLLIDKEVNIKQFCNENNISYKTLYMYLNKKRIKRNEKISKILLEKLNFEI